MEKDKFLRKPSSDIDLNQKGKFEIFNLSENPFPSTPIVNKDSNEKKFNGSIYEASIREKEEEKIVTNFLSVPQSQLDHLRLGFIIDSSYIGRGNGKSTFLLNLTKKINNDYCLEYSNGANKCFATYFAPEGGGKTKTFEKFVDIFFNSILNSRIIDFCLASIRLEAIMSMEIEGFTLEDEFSSEEDIIEKLNNDNWYDKKGIYKGQMMEQVLKNPSINKISNSFPIFKNYTVYHTNIITQTDFEKYYFGLGKEKEKYDFIFNDMVHFFSAAGFNGAYVLIDDFERIPDFQSAVQKKDFAIQLRTILFDGLYLNSKVGFYNMIFALHAGVPRLMQDAWGLAGLEQRISITSNSNAKHIISFDKINDSHAILLVQKYLSEYRMVKQPQEKRLEPFTEDAIKLIGTISEMNASKILQLANNLIDYAAETKTERIDDNFVISYTKATMNFNSEVNEAKNISTTGTIDLIDKLDQGE